MADQEPIAVLLVEDEPMDQRLIERTIVAGPDEFTVEVAEDLASARTLLDERSFNCVILDITLPDGNGFELLDTLTSATGETEIPVIVLTGTADGDVARHALGRGAQDYLIKGEYTYEILRRAVLYAVQRHRAQRLERENERLRRRSAHDPLTSVLNRNGLEKALAIERSRCEENGGELFGLLIDIDDFKSINDRFGHGVGDTVLKQVARALLENARSTEHVARVGGDEFVVLLTGARHAQLTLIGEKLRAAIKRTFADTQPTVTASIGAGVVSGCEDTTELLAVLGSSLKRSKQSGKDTVSVEIEVFEREEKFARRTTDRIVQQLTQTSGFQVVDRPIVSLRHAKTIATELVAEPPGFDFASENQLFLYCEREGITQHVDLARLDVCVSASGRLDSRQPLHLRIFPTTMLSSSWDDVEGLLRPMLAERPCVLHVSHELFEGEPLGLRERFRRVRSWGVCVAVDDTRVSATDFQSLLMISPEYVRVGGDWFSSISQAPWRLRVLRRFVRAIETLGAEVMARDVETVHDAITLWKCGVRWAQGAFDLAEYAETLERALSEQDADADDPWDQPDTIEKL